MLWQIIFLAAGILSLIYYSVICVTLKKWDSTFSRFWLVLGVAGIAGSRLTVRYGMPCVVELVIGIGVFLLLISEVGIVRCSATVLIMYSYFYTPLYDIHLQFFTALYIIY